MSSALAWEDVQDAVGRRELWLRLTRVCNEACSFCYDESAMNGTVVPFEMLHRQLREGRAKGLDETNFTGGEPTLHPHFPKVVRLAKLLGYGRVHVTTNGRRFKERAFADAAAEAGLTSAGFSIHGHEAALNDALTEAPGSFRDSVAGLRNALAAGIDCSVNVVLCRDNAPHAAEILSFFRGLGASMVNFLELVPVSGAWERRDALFPREGDGWRRVWELFERSASPELRALAPGLLARHVEYVASTARVPGYAGILSRLLETGEAQPCRGEKCPLCPLDGPCRDLERLRAEGELQARPASPDCVPERSSAPARGPGPALSLKGATLQGFLSFYIEHRLRVKGSACSRCSKDASCAGAPARLVSARGFPEPI